MAEALDAGVELAAVYLEPDAAEHPVVEHCRRVGVQIREVQPGVLARALDLASPRAIVAVGVQRTVPLDAVLDAAVRHRRPALALVGLQDPGNAGTLLRVAEAAGCVGVVVTTGSVDVHNPKTVRATAGSLFRVPVAEGVDTARLRVEATARGIPTWATVRDAGVSLDSAELTGPSILLVGSEAHGLPEEIRAVADGLLSIPMEGGVESLNAAVAGALVAFEAARQRRADGVAGTVRRGSASDCGATNELSHDVDRPAASRGSGPGDEQGAEERST